MAKSVAIFGGGVAGLTAAHELACRGFRVDLYEACTADEGVGGKARTQFWSSTAGGGRLPGEHGFRFFPDFYYLLDDTLQRTPRNPDTADPSAALGIPSAASILDNLIPTPRGCVGRSGARVLEYPRCAPQDLSEISQLVRLYVDGMRLSVTDTLHIAARLLAFFTSGDQRRLGEYERITFWDFMDAEALGPDAQAILTSAPKSLVAMDAQRGNARTLGNLLFLILCDQTRDGSRTDRTLAGPTTTMWLDPWRRWLERLGVRFHYDARLERFECDARQSRITCAWMAGAKPVHADHYVAALPMEAMQALVTDELANCCDQLARLRRVDLARTLAWMAGAQFYLAKDVPVVRGHVNYADAPWALTSISQAQFWSPRNFKRQYGNGRVAGILSADICDWDRPGIATPKTARQCSRAELFEELVAQIGAVQTAAGRPVLDRANVLDWHLDEAIQFAGDCVAGNLTPMLIHPPNFWAQRPTPITGIRNLFLAGDYVRHDLDLASMEGANASAREAVNGILDREDDPAPRCRLINHLAHNEPEWLKLIKRCDDAVYSSKTARRGADLMRSICRIAPVNRDEIWRCLGEAERRMRRRC